MRSSVERRLNVLKGFSTEFRSCVVNCSTPFLCVRVPSADHGFDSHYSGSFSIQVHDDCLLLFQVRAFVRASKRRRCAHKEYSNLQPISMPQQRKQDRVRFELSFSGHGSGSGSTAKFILFFNTDCRFDSLWRRDRCPTLFTNFYTVL